ncbi:MAG: PaaI family thioesterase [Syntrophomonadaceae bacterium]|nr:PaaI family thioesterase [Syntrophomonadaceae bacterium]
MENQPNSQVCFICGRENEVGLQAQYYNDAVNQQVIAHITIPSRFNGWPGYAHGGIVAALLDEGSFRAIWIDGNFQRTMVTANLNIRLQRPTPTEQPVKSVGWIIDMNESRARVGSEIRLLDGTVTARGEATLVRAPDSFIGAKDWEQLQTNWKVG